MELLDIESEKFGGSNPYCDLDANFSQETDYECINDLSPLDVDIVIRKLFGYLDLSSLLSARRVCKRWNLHGASILHKRCSKLKIVFTDDLWSNASRHGLNAMKDFVNFCNETGECPFEIFDIGTSILIEKGNERIVLEFLAFCGQYIRDLTVRDDYDVWEMQEGTHNNGIPKCLHFHCLQKLSILLDGDSGLDRLELFYGIMIASPNVNHLCLRTTKMDHGEAVEWLIRALANCSCKIKRLKIFAQIQEAQLLSLGAADLSLERLTLDFWGSHISDPDILKNFFLSQSKTLKYLKLSDESRTFLCAIQFPCMKELITLKIKGSILGSIAMSFPSICYFDHFPKLQSLSFSNLSWEWESFFRTDINKSSYTVEELRLACSTGGYSDGGQCLFEAAILFPRLRKLEIPHYPYLLEVVFGQMSQLEELVIITNEVTVMDEIITGIPQEICEAMNEIGNYDAILKGNRLKILQKSPSIRSLTSKISISHLYAKEHLFDN